MYAAALGATTYGDLGASSAPPTLRYGSKDNHAGGTAGSWVTVLQAALMGRGYPVGASGQDGDFGLDTQAAVQSFQRANGLPATGVVDGGTWAALGHGGERAAPGSGLLTVMETLATTIAPFTPAGQERILASQQQTAREAELQVYLQQQAQAQERQTQTGEGALWKKIALFGGMGVAVLLVVTVALRK